MKRCEKCGHESVRDIKFCEKCGEARAVEGVTSDGTSLKDKQEVSKDASATDAKSSGSSGLKGSLASSRPAVASASEPGSTKASEAVTPSSSLKGPLFSAPSKDAMSASSPPVRPTAGSPPGGSALKGTLRSGSPTMPPPPMSSRPPGAPPPPPPGYPGPGKPKSALPKVLLGIAGIAAVALITIGLMNRFSEEAEPPEEPYIAYEEYEEEDEEEIEEEEIEEEEEEEELTPLTAREVYDNNVDAVFTIFMRVPDYWTEAEISRYVRYPLFLPTGSYVPTGSGFFVNDEGVAVTNHHVVVDLDYMVARTHDGEVHPILGYYTYDIDNDIAIIQVEGSGFPYTTFTEIPIGVADYVYAIGSSAGDPNTFTSGVVSRFAEEIQFGIYTVTDMIQFTAPIYGGNSGGPLFNQFGQVVGIVSAGDMMRASVGFAVRIERVDLEGALRASINSFPLGDGLMATTPTVSREYYDSFPMVPTLESIVNEVFFLMGGAARDLELDGYGYERSYMYLLFGADAYRTVDLYEDALLARGFIWQDDVEGPDDTEWFYFYHQAHDLSVTLWYLRNYDMMVVAIGHGNIYQDFYGYQGIPGGDQAEGLPILRDGHVAALPRGPVWMVA